MSTFDDDAVAMLDALYEEFGKPLPLTIGGITKTPPVIFSEPFKGLNQGSGMIETVSPMARCKAADASAAGRGDTLVKNDVTYYVIGKQPSEDGLETFLILSLDPP